MTRALLSHLASLLGSFCLVVLLLAGLPGNAGALSPQRAGSGGSEAPAAVVEQLRLKVPAGTQRAWLQAEQESWGPWLRRQDGFLGRDLLWDAEREEGLLLIRWRSRRQWLAIPKSDIDVVQGQFEAAARRVLAQATPTAANPFPLIYAGELEWVGLTPAAAAEELR
ncbi:MULTISPECIES: TIGR03792 family protein [unclassified Cyanobium]|uniref:TIGR03792 family protein n=1 Tax=unclassified Cyanobium TaxID=2627006 RepID=UPI0020CE985D|nr:MULTISPECIES: TIGR03792 family protein [unclassified Cyanobium]MCP9833691.1 TIGR03792 family protein [Cyanobium sp. La Preciosa 7G6]MCP9936551.1 TIGR03792 family protein [Cyanobium sp. Aljojuca 7A6]